MLRILLSQSGMSMVSVLVASAIGLIVAMGISTTMTQVFKANRSLSERDDISELVLAIRRDLYTEASCTSAIAGFSVTPALPVLGSTVERQVFLNGAMAGVWPMPDGWVGITSHSKFSETLSIEKALIYDRGDAPYVVYENGTPYDRIMVRIVLYFASIGPTLDGMGYNTVVQSYRPRSFDIPVLIGGPPGNRRVVKCMNEPSFGETCEITGGVVSGSGASAQCVPQTVCRSAGSYASVYSDPGGVLGSAGITYVNPMTGGYSCPTGYSTVEQGNITYYYSVVCGKTRCSRTATARVYACLICP